MSNLNLVSLQSDRVSPQTRQVLEERIADASMERCFFDEQEFRTLQLLTDCVLPQTTAGTHVSIALAIDTQLTRRQGSGWRYASLPVEQEAYRKALHELSSYIEGRVTAPLDLQSLLEAIQRKEHDSPDFAMSLWFENFRADVVRHWLAHPQTMALMHYDGFADALLTPQDSAPGESR